MVRLRGLEVERKIAFQQALYDIDPRAAPSVSFEFVAEDASARTTIFGRQPTLEGLDQSSPYVIQFSKGYDEWPPALIRGAISLEQSLDQIWSLSFTIDDRTRVMMAGGVKDPNKVLAPNESRWASLYGRGVEFFAQYLSWPDTQISFTGIIMGVKPNFDDSGDVTLTITAQASEFRMTRTFIRRLTYPAVKTPDAAAQGEEAAEATDNQDMVKLYNRPWAEGRPFQFSETNEAAGVVNTINTRVITLGEIISHIATKVYTGVNVDIDPDFFAKPYIYTDIDTDGNPNTIVQENESDWMFLSRLAKEVGAYFWMDDIPKSRELPLRNITFSGGDRVIATGGSRAAEEGTVTGRTMRFQKDRTIQNQQSRINFVFNTAFGDGARQNYVSPEEVNLTDPDRLPMFNISPNMDLVFAAPAARGYFLLTPDGAVAHVMNTRDGDGGFTYQTLDADKLYEQYREYRSEIDASARDERDPDLTQWVGSILPVFERIDRWGKFPTYEQLLAGGFLTTGVIRAFSKDKADDEARAQYWRPNWTISFDTFGTIKVRPGDLVELHNIATFMDGTWIVQNARHTFDGNSWSTNVTVARGVRPSREQPITAQFAS